ncbi:MAG: hypothetical protein AAGF66_11385 [Cyanobacteria bacterium P01_H01_bin.119]
MRQRHNHRHLLLWSTAKAIKYFLLSVASCTLAYFISMIFSLHWLSGWMTTVLQHVLPQASALLGCLTAIAVISESLKS